MDAGEAQPEPAESSEPILNIDFRRYLGAIRRYRWLPIITFALAIAAAVVYTLTATPVYEATASVQIEPRLPDLLGTGDMFNVASSGNNTAEYYKQQRRVLGSYTLCKQTVQQFDLYSKLLTSQEIKSLSTDDKTNLATSRLQKMISVRYPEQDRIMYVYVRSPDPALATEIANDHIATYVDYAKGLLTMDSTKAAEALQAEFNDVEAKLRAAEDKIYKFQADNNMIAVTLEEHQNLVSQNILAFTQKLNDARANQIAVEAKLAQMKKESQTDVLSSAIALVGDDQNNSSFETLRAEYYAEKIHLIELSKDLGEKNPDYLAQKEKVDELYKALNGEVQILINGTQDIEAAAAQTTSGLSDEVEKYKDEAKRLSPLIVQYNEYERERKQIEDQYTILRARLSSAMMTGNMSSVISNVHPLDPALTPKFPVSPSMPLDVGIACGAAFLISVGLLFLLVFLDRSIKTSDDASTAARAPVLGFIPELTGSEVPVGDVRGRDMFIHENPKSHVAECVRALRTNVMFSAAEQQQKTFVVCSANAKEGKTTIVMYLGTTIAQSGEKVLLVDTDMRRPRLHVSTNVQREPGLSNLLLGDENYDELIRATEVPNLYVLPCGPLPPNPAELLMTKRFEHVLAELRKRFSKVILDSPPLQPVTDAVVLARQTDGVILVARSGRTIRDELRRSANMLRSVDARIFGVVLNELDRSYRESSYYYTYYGVAEDNKGVRAA